MRAQRIFVEAMDKPMGLNARSPRFTWHIEQGGGMQSAYRLQVATQESFDAPVWDSQWTRSGESSQVPYAGEALAPRTRYYVRVQLQDGAGEGAFSAPTYWETGLMDAHAARFITPYGKKSPKLGPCPFLRREFTLRRGIVRARAYATAFGMYELSLNGKRAGGEYLSPGFTSYNHRTQVQCYDVTAHVKPGKNAVAALLGDGWYAGNIGWQKQFHVYGDRPAFYLELWVDYADGKSEVVCSDKHFRWAFSAINSSGIYAGEEYDARAERAGFDRAGYPSEGLLPVRELRADLSCLVGQEGPPVRVTQALKPRRMLTTPGGATVLDMGQNMVGRLRFCVRGPAGASVTLTHFEVLDKDGEVYLENLRSAKQRVRYIKKGDGPERFAPHFTFQGFRYVRLEGFDAPRLSDFSGEVMHSDMERTGHFSCSSAELNQLMSNIVWGQRGNFVDVPTDCPQRDERLGWTGDAQAFVRTACFFYQTQAFFEKWLRDLSADQRPDGAVPHVVPNVLGAKNAGSSAWADAAVIVPMELYRSYGDMRVLRQQYESMKAHVGYMQGAARGGLYWADGHHFGDWLGLDAHEGSYVGATDKPLIATAFYAHSALLLAKAAAILGEEADAQRYGELAAQVRARFCHEYLTPSGRLACPTQTAHVLALHFRLVPDASRPGLAAALADMVKQAGHLTTGFIGTCYLCHVLAEAGYPDLAYQLLLRREYPSWLYPLEKGATTMWEHWDGIKPDGSFWSRDMNSFNHYAYGCIADFIIPYVGGVVQPEGDAGYRSVTLIPRPQSSMTHASTSLVTPQGELSFAWQDAGSVLRCEAVIPPNTKATLVLPTKTVELAPGVHRIEG